MTELANKIRELEDALSDMTRDRDEWRELHGFEQRNRLESDAERDEAVRGHENMSVLADEFKAERDAARAEVERLKRSDMDHRTMVSGQIRDEWETIVRDLRAEVVSLTQERDGLRELLREAAIGLEVEGLTYMATRIRRQGGMTDGE